MCLQHELARDRASRCVAYDIVTIEHPHGYMTTKEMDDWWNQHHGQPRDAAPGVEREARGANLRALGDYIAVYVDDETPIDSRSQPCQTISR